MLPTPKEKPLVIAVAVGSAVLGNSAANTPLARCLLQSFYWMHQGTSQCTLHGDNPYATGTLIPCCEGLQECTGDTA